MHIIRAKHLGMCFGVRDAIALAFEQAETRPLTILGDLVHNPSVSADIRARGIATVRELAQVTTQTVMVTAHGASERTLARTRALGLEVVEATCPLVHVAHKAVRTLVGQGYYPVIVGQRDHVEVRGLTEDLLEFDVVMDERDVMALTPRARIGVAAQTTQPIEKVRRLVQLIQRRFPASEVRFVDTVCQPTKQRQNAALALSRESDVVVVVGGANSNNTRELVNTCRTHGARVYHVQSELDLRPEWFADANTVGLTAGTSTPDAVIDRVENRLREWAARTTEMNVSLAQSAR
jgi:4-hydroxy-3-methylbut-2-en-1-yl diphosphate reductase